MTISLIEVKSSISLIEFLDLLDSFLILLFTLFYLFNRTDLAKKRLKRFLTIRGSFFVIPGLLSCLEILLLNGEGGKIVERMNYYAYTPGNVMVLSTFLAYIEYKYR